MKALSLLTALLIMFTACEFERSALYDEAESAAEEPEGITDLRVTGVTLTSISFEWDPVDGATTYRLYRSPDSEFTAPYMLTDSLITAFTDSESMIMGGGTFYYRVGVVLSTGEEFSNTVDARTGTVPLAPAWLNAAAGVDNVNLTWAAVSGATSYNIHRNNETSPFVTDIKVTNYRDSIVGDWTYNSYQVKAVNEFGMSDYSPSADAYAPLGPVGNLTVVESSSTSVTLSWEPVRNVSYYVVKATGFSDHPNGNSTMYTYSSLTAGTSYTFQVVAYSYGEMYISATPEITLDTFTRVPYSEISGKSGMMVGSPLEYTMASEMPQGSVFIYCTQAGLYGKFEVQNDVFSVDENLAIRWITYDADGAVLFNGNGVIIPNGYYCDLDTNTGAITNTPMTPMDFQWSILSSIRTITPIGTSVFYKL